MLLIYCLMLLPLSVRVGCVFGPCSVIHYSVSFLVLQRERERERERERVGGG